MEPIFCGAFVKSNYMQAPSNKKADTYSEDRSPSVANCKKWSASSSVQLVDLIFAVFSTVCSKFISEDAT